MSSISGPMSQGWVLQNVVAWRAGPDRRKGEEESGRHSEALLSYDRTNLMYFCPCSLQNNLSFSSLILGKPVISSLLRVYRIKECRSWKEPYSSLAPISRCVVCVTLSPKDAPRKKVRMILHFPWISAHTSQRWTPVESRLL